MIFWCMYECQLFCLRVWQHSNCVSFVYISLPEDRGHWVLCHSWFNAVLRSRHFFGRLRLRNYEVGSGSIQKKAAQGSSGSIHKFFLFFALKKLIINTSPFLDHIDLYKLLLSHVWHKNNVFLFACIKGAGDLSTPTNKKIDSGAGAALKVAAPGGSGSATLIQWIMNIVIKCISSFSHNEFIHHWQFCPGEELVGGRGIHAVQMPHSPIVIGINAM